MRCDACQGIFCKDHYLYIKHSCEKSYLKDNQVPVCPLCDTPIPIKRGDVPDIRVSDHIDNECQDSRAKSKRSSPTIFTNKCNVKGCKQKELIPVLCYQCKINFCLKHRHPGDHSCDPRAARIPKSFQQSVASSASASMSSMRSTAAAAASTASRKIGDLFKQRAPEAPAIVDEDEALARAIRASLADHATSVGRPPVLVANQRSDDKSLQEEEDRQLAQAIAESQNVTPAAGSTSRASHDKCSLS